MDAFRSFGSVWAEVVARHANANPFCVRLLSTWTQIRHEFGPGLHLHGQQTDAPHVNLVSALAPRVRHPTSHVGPSKCARAGRPATAPTLLPLSAPSASLYPSRLTVNPTLAGATSHHAVEAHALSPQPQGGLLLGAAPRGDLHGTRGCTTGARLHPRRPLPVPLGERHPYVVAGREPATQVAFEPG